MAEQQTSITPTREERRPARSRPFGWGGSTSSSLQRFADEMDRMFDNFGLGRRWGRAPSWPETGAELWAPDVDVLQKNRSLREFVCQPQAGPPSRTPARWGGRPAWTIRVTDLRRGASQRCVRSRRP